ncbi:hypothetical protein NUSPORA_00822 [Nucleospora cyclopteri]
MFFISILYTFINYLSCTSFIDIHKNATNIKLEKNDEDNKYFIAHTHKRRDKVSLISTIFQERGIRIAIPENDYFKEENMKTLGVPRINRFFIKMDDAHDLNGEVFTGDSEEIIERRHNLIDEIKRNNENITDATLLEVLEQINDGNIENVEQYLQYEFVEAKIKKLLESKLFYFLIETADGDFATDISYINNDVITRVRSSIIDEDENIEISVSETVSEISEVETVLSQHEPTFEQSDNGTVLVNDNSSVITLQNAIVTFLILGTITSIIIFVKKRSKTRIKD